ncbi:MAG TPA: choice-of-anchor D domain-containing protein [Terriglobia bacterium]|nr:choice-of-anchor D domain-containing protein [Terriglobia bacterium]
MRVRLKIVLILVLFAGGARGAAAQITVSPTSLSFGSVAVNVQGFASYVTITNNYSTSVNLTSITLGSPEYGIYTGLPVQTIGAHAKVSQFAFVFRASQPGTYDSTITFNFKGLPSVVIQTSATAFTTTAAATLSTNSLNFGSVSLGASSASQTVTVTNTGGPDSIKLSAVELYYQPFIETGPLPPVTLAPGQSASYQVSFSPLTTGSTTASLTFCYNNLPCNGVDLTGTGAAPAKLALTNYPVLPYSTRGYAYQGNMTASGGKTPYIFRLHSGSMPGGLSLAQSGAITGTVSSTDKLGNYTFTVQVQDSSTPKRLTATETLTLPVDAGTGANCAILSEDVPNTTNPIVDIMDLGTGTYCPEGDPNCTQCPFGENCEGGLYPGGSNTDPDPHHSDGVAIAQAIQPINGKYVMISLGESASQQPFEQFITQGSADPELNSNLVIVDGAEGGATANTWASSTSVYWTDLIDYSLPFAGVTADQVVAAWISDVNSAKSCNPGNCFPGDAQTLQTDYEDIAQLLLQNFPNIKMMFFSSMNYSGYSTGVDTTLPEPQAYESAFGAKWAIADQINGNPNLNYNPNNGPVKAPWMGWSVYDWANGLTPRSDGITWSCQDLSPDGLHPANPWGHVKIAQYLLNWFKTADLTAPWFVKP